MLWESKKFEKNHPYQRSQENLFSIIIMPKSYQQIGKQNNEFQMKLSIF